VEGLVIRGSTSVLTRAETEKEGDADHVCNGLSGGGRGLVVCKVEGMHHEGDGDRLDPGGGRVQLCIGLELGSQPEVKTACGVGARVFGPQAGERLAH